MDRDETPGLRTSVLDSTVALSFAHRVRFTRRSLDPANPALREVFAHDAAVRDRRAVVVLDGGFAAANPAFDTQLRAYAAAHAPSMPALVETVVVPGGEAAKHDTRVADLVVELVERHRIDRKSFVIAVGGGAVLDAAGYGAAIAHRGVRLVRLPTTTLAQDDAAMGVKNGVNRFGKKNFVGAFAVPHAVLCDELLLATLPDAVFRAGFSEAVKIALLKDPALFAAIERDAARIAARELDAASPVIRASAHLHLRHIVDGGDPFEANEARPLDFGHWAAHRLESMSAHAVSHGDAVALGLLLDCRYSNLKGWLSDADHARIRAAISGLGLPMRHPLLADAGALLRGLEEFREHLGGRLTITMLRGIGQGFEVHELDAELVRRAAAELA
ncbi:MAG: 3-dehydroquinate synthase [Planctomycetaceae bacterium]|nr:3-dehydroquinate synthase [Planctomycetaceae bacterium]